MSDTAVMLSLFAGLVAVVSCLIYLILFKIVSMRKPLSLKPLLKKANKRQHKRVISDWYPVFGALFGILSSLLLTWGSTWNGSTVIIMMWFGAVVGYTARYILSKENKYGSLHETSTFFKAVSVRLKNGYNVYHTLRVATILAPTLQPVVYRCLQRWSNDPHKALEGLRQEIKVPEADTLLYVLLRAHEAGGESVSHVLDQGARSIEHKLAELEEKGFASGKMRYLFYRMLPGMSIFGIVAGSFGYYAQTVLYSSISNLK